MKTVGWRHPPWDFLRLAEVPTSWPANWQGKLWFALWKPSSFWVTLCCCAHDVRPQPTQQCHLSVSLDSSSPQSQTQRAAMGMRPCLKYIVSTMSQSIIFEGAIIRQTMKPADLQYWGSSCKLCDGQMGNLTSKPCFDTSHERLEPCKRSLSKWRALNHQFYFLKNFEVRPYFEQILDIRNARVSSLLVKLLAPWGHDPSLQIFLQSKLAPLLLQSPVQSVHVHLSKNKSVIRPKQRKGFNSRLLSTEISGECSSPHSDGHVGIGPSPNDGFLTLGYLSSHPKALVSFPIKNEQ